MAPSIVVGISAHGFGHIAQVSPVVEALHRRAPEHRVIVVSAANETVLRDFIRCPFEIVHSEQDPGVTMQGPLRVDGQATFQRHRHWHTHHESHKQRLLKLLEHYQPGIVVSDIGYTILEAAKHAGIPSVALSSLNWADIILPYCRGFDGAAELHARIIDAYNAADRFIQVEPSMPMPRIERVTTVGPVARTGTDRKRELLAQLRLAPGTQLAVLSLGGIPASLSTREWSVPPDTHWIVPDNCEIDGPGFTHVRDTGMAYLDLLASADALITKPGYGSFTEAACHQVPVIYVRRGDWPEEQALVDWLHRRGTAVELPARQFAVGDYLTAFEQLAGQRTRPRVTPTGNEQAAALILEAARLPGGTA